MAMTIKDGAAATKYLGAAGAGTSSGDPFIPAHAIESNAMCIDGTETTPLFAVISAASSGANTIVAADATKKIRVLSYLLVSSGTVSANWENGTTDISGVMPLVAQSVLQAAFNPLGHFETAANALLGMTLSGAVGVYGHVTYIKV